MSKKKTLEPNSISDEMVVHYLGEIELTTSRIYAIDPCRSDRDDPSNVIIRQALPGIWNAFVLIKPDEDPLYADMDNCLLIEHRDITKATLKPWTRQGIVHVCACAMALVDSQWFKLFFSRLDLDLLNSPHGAILDIGVGVLLSGDYPVLCEVRKNLENRVMAVRLNWPSEVTARNDFLDVLVRRFNGYLSRYKHENDLVNMFIHVPMDGECFDFGGVGTRESESINEYLSTERFKAFLQEIKIDIEGGFQYRFLIDDWGDEDESHQFIATLSKRRSSLEKVHGRDSDPFPSLDETDYWIESRQHLIEAYNETIA